MKPYRSICSAILLALILPLSAPAQQEKIDTLALARIKEEGLQKSQVMNLLRSLSDEYGPRLAWSPEYRRGADWVVRTLKGWGIDRVNYDNWAPVGKGWTLKNFSAMVTAPIPFPVIAYPSAWSPGLKEKEAEVVLLDVKRLEELEKYRGKLKGKFVLLSDLVPVRAHFSEQASRLADSVLLRMANADQQPGRRGRRPPRFDPTNIDSILTAMKKANPDTDTAAMRDRLLESQVGPRKLAFAQEEGALAVITGGRGDGGTMIVQSATVPRGANDDPSQRVSIYDPKAPEVVPQVVFAAEHYNRMVRMIRAGEKVKLEMEMQVTTAKADSGFNVIAEIPGTDLKDEIVMVGGHFDTWHAGTGTTDNNSGSAASLEAMRIVKVLADRYGMKPRRTIRIGLWGAEEEGLIGSREYVAEKFARREQGAGGGGFGGGGPVTRMPEFDRLSVYFNHDNGTGRVRGIYLQGNEAARPIFRSWLTAYGDPTAQTVTIQNTGGTDHQSFDGVGLPGFQFIQDPIEYDSRTHHYNMDLFERAQEEDMKQAATIMAFFAYSAATRDGMFPRKPVTPPAASVPGTPPAAPAAMPSVAPAALPPR